MHSTTKNETLKIRCSDGITTKPDYLRERTVHEIRLPGGILFPELCAAHFSRKVVVKLLRRVMLFAVQKLIDLKNPDEIVLMAHDPCGTASILNMDRNQIFIAHLGWQKILQNLYPDLLVRVMFEEHSACGTIRKPHFYIDGMSGEEKVKAEFGSVAETV